MGTAHLELDPWSATGAAVIAIGAVLAVSCCYTRFCAPNAGIPHALGVGTAWLVLAITAEVAMSRWLGHSWYALLGSPDRPMLRNVFLFVWIFAPAFFAHGEVEE